MSEILFIVKNEGRGHFTQALSLKSILESNGHKVLNILVGSSKLRCIPDYFIEKAEIFPIEFQSPNFVVDKKNKSIKIIYSILKNILLFPVFLKSASIINKEVQKHNPDMIINFNDPLVFLYKLIYSPRIPVCMITHSLMYIHPKYIFPPQKKFYRFLMKKFTQITAFGIDKKIALSFYTFPDIKDKNIYICPPLLRSKLFQTGTYEEEFLLAYILNKGYKDEIIKWHKKNTNIIIHCFYDGNDDSYDSTLTFHKLNDKLFEYYMSRCKALITTAGFESVCEAFYLGKPVMMVPVAGQFEQYFNSRDAAKLNAGIYSDDFNINLLIEYLDNYKFDNQKFRRWVLSSEKRISDIIMN
ncbi:MAG: glycosyltransferase family protein [Bacteroidota bacterium]|nr:glycosyltransferase family protein [Bacteroidota bacterium]